MGGSIIGFVADIGNSRIKWGEVDDAGVLDRFSASPVDRPDLWPRLRESWSRSDERRPMIAVSSVNPRIAARFHDFLEDQWGGAPAPTLIWYRSAADVPIPHQLESPETAGADRGLAVAAALGALPEGRPGLVVSCGTAVTIERISRERIWQGGAIAPGLWLSARALNQNTAQLPFVEVGSPPPAWGSSTRPALAAGVFWGVVGGVRELLDRQLHDLPGDPWIIWTGGDADAIAGVIAGPQANITPHLVLQGLIQVSGMGRREGDR
jgi:type III pantothenate kinase